MSANHNGASPSTTSNAGDSKMDRTSSHHDLDEKDTSWAEGHSDSPRNEAAVPVIDPLQPGTVDAQLFMTKLDSKIPHKDEEKTQDPFAHLPEHEASVLRNQVETPKVKVGYATLFRYATKFDWLVIAVSLICAIVAGAAMPLMTVCPIIES